MIFCLIINNDQECTYCNDPHKGNMKIMKVMNYMRFFYCRVLKIMSEVPSFGTCIDACIGCLQVHCH